MQHNVNDDMARIPFSDLIGRPLRACIEAQEKASMCTWDYIQSIGLQDVTGSDNPQKELLMITFSFISEGGMASLRLPLLSVVPIPYFSIDTLDISFRANIKSVQVTEETGETSLKGINNITGRRTENILASYSISKDSESIESSEYNVENAIDVRIRATQDHMPAGLSKVLAFMEQAIQVKTPQIELKDTNMATAIRDFRYKFSSLPNSNLSPVLTSIPGLVPDKSDLHMKEGVIDRSYLQSIEVLSFLYSDCPFNNIDDLANMDNLTAFICDKIVISSIYSFSMQNLSSVALLSLNSNGDALHEKQHIPNFEFKWLHKIQTLFLSNFQQLALNQVILSNSFDLVSLVIYNCHIEVVDISVSKNIQVLKIESGNVKELIVWRGFSTNKLQICKLPNDIIIQEI